MNILFLTLLDFNSIDERNIYTDLLREFYKNGHSVHVISPVEKRKNQETKLLKADKATILKLKIGNTQKTNIIEKGISTISIEPQFIAGIKKYFSDVEWRQYEDYLIVNNAEALVSYILSCHGNQNMYIVDKYKDK